ncbi:MAG: hypothetical protein WC435_01895 [Candidatus Paceibacterota bacterium]
MQEKLSKKENSAEKENFTTVDASGNEYIFKIGDIVYEPSFNGERNFEIKIKEINKEEKKFFVEGSSLTYYFDRIFFSREAAEARLEEIKKDQEEKKKEEELQDPGITTIEEPQEEKITKPSDSEFRNAINGTLKNKEPEGGEEEKEIIYSEPETDRKLVEELKEIKCKYSENLQNFKVGEFAFYPETNTGKVTQSKIEKLDKKNNEFFSSGNWLELQWFFGNKKEAEEYAKKEHNRFSKSEEIPPAAPEENSASVEEITNLSEKFPPTEPIKIETEEIEEKKSVEEESKNKEITITNKFGLEQNFEEGKKAFYINRDNGVSYHDIKILDLERERFFDEKDVWHPLKYYFSSSEDASNYLNKSKKESQPVLEENQDELTLDDIFIGEELKEVKESLEEVELLAGSLSEADLNGEKISEEIAEAVEKLSEKQKKTLFEGVADAGYYFKENSNWILKNIFSRVNISNDFLNRHFKATAEAFEKKENEAREKREKIGKGMLEKSAGWSSVPSAILRWGRILHGYGLSSPFRIAMMGSMATGFLAEIEKSARLKNKEVIKKVRVDDLKRAEEEALRLYEEAEKLANEKGKEKASAEDFKEAYEKSLLGDLAKRVNRQNISAYYTSLADIRIRRTVFKLNDKFNQIENDKKLGEKQKELEKEKLLKKNAEFLKELDSMVSDFGMVDHLSYYSGLVSKGAKTLTSALTLETLIESVWKNSDHIENAFEFVKEKSEEGAKSIWGKIADFFMKENPVPSDNYASIPSEKLTQLNVEPEGFEPVQSKLSETTEQTAYEPNVSEIQGDFSEKSAGITGVAEELKMAEQTLPKVSIETPDIFKSAEHLDYQGGKSVWKEAELQLQGRFKELFENLGADEKSKEALKIYNIDRLKDIVLSNPEKYGLPENPNFRRLSKEMIESIKWDEAFRDAFPKEILTENLSKEAIENIIGTGEDKENWQESSYYVKEIPAPDNLNLPIVENQELPSDNLSSENIEEQAEIGEKYREAPLEQIEEKTEKFMPPSNSAEAIEKLKQSGFQIADENEFIKELGLEKENPEKINETLISLSNLDLDNPEEAKRMIEVSKLSELPLETIDKHIYFALSEDFTPEQSSAVIELLENDKDKEALEFFRKSFRDIKSVSAEKFLDKRVGESLRIFFTGKNSRADFELVINKGKFFVDGINIEHPLKDFKSFLKFPSRFITSNLKR